MPSWEDLAYEIQCTPSAISTVRGKYLSIMREYTGRNVIAYYSAFLQKKGTLKTGIDDADKNAFMQAIYGLKKDEGLDLILHTPGGNLAATESIVEYLKKMFNNDIRAFVPQIAMSAGTMMALAAKEIIMGKQSNLGPIDPQFNGLSCAGIIEEFEGVCNAVKSDPDLIKVWALIISKYHPTFIGDCQKAIKWSKVMVKEWLKDNMFRNDKDRDKIVKKIVTFLSSHSKTYSHSKHIHFDKLKSLGLKVIALENLDSKKIGGCRDLQDCVLTLHHAYMQTLANSNAIKIIENHLSKGLIITVVNN